jgi:hypothetical protein
VQRLETLVELKKLYRNIIRAEALLALSSPVYTPPDGEAAAAAQLLFQMWHVPLQQHRPCCNGRACTVFGYVYMPACKDPTAFGKQ